MRWSLNCQVESNPIAHTPYCVLKMKPARSQACRATEFTTDNSHSVNFFLSLVFRLVLLSFPLFLSISRLFCVCRLSPPKPVMYHFNAVYYVVGHYTIIRDSIATHFCEFVFFIFLISRSHDQTIKWTIFHKCFGCTDISIWNNIAKSTAKHTM